MKIKENSFFVNMKNLNCVLHILLRYPRKQKNSTILYNFQLCGGNKKEN